MRMNRDKEIVGTLPEIEDVEGHTEDLEGMDTLRRGPLPETEEDVEGHFQSRDIERDLDVER